jgi:hypothetical protein
MAVDTRNKRASVLGLTLAALVILPAPNGSVTAPDRLQVSAGYAGIAATGVLVTPADAIGELNSDGTVSYLGGDAAFSTLGGSLAGSVLGGSLAAPVLGGDLS